MGNCSSECHTPKGRGLGPENDQSFLPGLTSRTVLSGSVCVPVSGCSCRQPRSWQQLAYHLPRGLPQLMAVWQPLTRSLRVLGLVQSLEWPFRRWGKVPTDKGTFSRRAFQSPKLGLPQVAGKAGDKAGRRCQVPGPCPCLAGWKSRPGSCKRT